MRIGTKNGNVSTEKSFFLQKLESQVRKPLKSLGSSCDLQPFPFMHLHHFIFGSDALSFHFQTVFRVVTSHYVHFLRGPQKRGNLFFFVVPTL